VTSLVSLQISLSISLSPHTQVYHALPRTCGTVTILSDISSFDNHISSTTDSTGKYSMARRLKAMRPRRGASSSRSIREYAAGDFSSAYVLLQYCMGQLCTGFFVPHALKPMFIACVPRHSLSWRDSSSQAHATTVALVNHDDQALIPEATDKHLRSV
jgi:hypothetical protein